MGDDYDFTSEDAAKVDLVLGIWKPIQMHNPVYDNPLALCHADTCDASQIVPTFVWQKNSLSDRPSMYEHKSGGVKHYPRNRWYYYSYQTCDEALVFTHWSRPQE